MRRFTVLNGCSFKATNTNKLLTLRTDKDSPRDGKIKPAWFCVILNFNWNSLVFSSRLPQKPTIVKESWNSVMERLWLTTKNTFVSYGFLTQNGREKIAHLSLKQVGWWNYSWPGPAAVRYFKIQDSKNGFSFQLRWEKIVYYFFGCSRAVVVQRYRKLAYYHRYREMRGRHSLRWETSYP